MWLSATMYLVHAYVALNYKLTAKQNKTKIGTKGPVALLQPHLNINQNLIK